MSTSTTSTGRLCPTDSSASLYASISFPASGSQLSLNGNDLKDDDSVIMRNRNEDSISKQAGLARLKRIYPFADLDELPLSWSPKDKANFISLSENNLKVHYKGNNKSHKDSASVRATHPIPRSCLLYYFEIKVVSKGRNGYMGIGLAAANVNLQRLPGWDKQSYGYHGDDGHCFSSSGCGQPYGPTFSTNDIIGCGYNLVENKCFFTKNGFSLGDAFTDLPMIPLYPTVGLQTLGEEVETNFGMEPFAYDIEQDLQQIRAKIQSSIINFPVPYNEWHEIINRLVQTWLVHNGYCSSAEVFSAASKQEFKANSTDVRQRLKIQQLVLSGQIGEAIQMTNHYYPTVLPDNLDLLFELRCRQFIEMYSGTDQLANGFCSSKEFSSLADCNGAGGSHSSLEQIGMEIDDVNNGNGFLMSSQVVSNGNSPATEQMATNGNSHHAHHINSDGMSSGILSLSASFDGQPQLSESSLQTPTSDSSEDCNGFSRPVGYSSNGITAHNEKRIIIDPRILKFGQDLHSFSQQLKKKFGPSEKNKQMLRDAFSLLAYHEASTSPVGWQLDPSQREPICIALNNAIVQKESNSCCEKPPLEMIIKHIKELLRHNGNFGAWLVEKL